MTSGSLILNKGNYAKGCIPSHPDQRDRKFQVAHGATPPPAKDTHLKSFLCQVFDQGQLGSCTGNAIAGAIKTRLKATGYKNVFTPSRLQIYYDERALEGTVFSDSGAMIRDGFKAINTNGVCPEDSGAKWSWTYSDGPFKFRMKPWPACYKDAKLHKCLGYMSVNQDRATIKAALAAGFPVVIGISVYESFESDATAKTGYVPMPQPSEALLGGHALFLWGYDETHAYGQNSWGYSWGDNGKFYIPWEYLESPDLGADFWAVEIVT